MRPNVDDQVIAWRPLPANAKEDLDPDEFPDYKDDLPREYLVKWTDRGFRHVCRVQIMSALGLLTVQATWVPHPWLLANAPAKLKNFIIKGPSLDLVTDETLAARGDDMAAPTIANLMHEADKTPRSPTHHKHGSASGGHIGGGPPPDVDAENSIPVAWKVCLQTTSDWCEADTDLQTVDRVLDVMLLPPPAKKKSAAKGKGKARATRSRSNSVFETDAETSENYKDGIEPPRNRQMDIVDWEEETGRQLDAKDVDNVAKLVSWCFVKWDDLQYEQCTSHLFLSIRLCESPC